MKKILVFYYPCLKPEWIKMPQHKHDLTIVQDLVLLTA